MSPHEFDTYVEMVEYTRKAYEGRMEVLLGLESDYYPGVEPLLEKLHTSAPLNYVLGSVHSHLPQYKEKYFTGDKEAFQRTYFQHLAEAAETGLFDCISHPDLVKNDFPRDWVPERIMDSIEACLDRIQAAGVAMEMNTSGLLKVISEMNPGPKILQEMHKRNIPVVLGSDSHHPNRVGAHFEYALLALKEIGFEEVSYFIERKRHTISIDDARNSLLFVEL